MSIVKQLRDDLSKSLARFVYGGKYVPAGLNEFNSYLRANQTINFKIEKIDGCMIAKSTDFRHGSIVTQASNSKELDLNIKDAILTSFEIPSSYSREANIRREGEKSKGYVYA